MQLTVNDEPRELAAGATLSNLVSDLGLSSARVAIEVNRTLIRRSEHGTHVLQEGDHVEIVTLVGGG